MKEFFIICLAFGLTTVSAQNLRVATYNLRYDNPGDSLDAWPFRIHAVAGVIGLYDFDIFGTQEGLKHQLEDLKKELPGYEYIGVGRDDGAQQGEHVAIFFKTAKLKLHSQGNFWLSPVTDKPNRGWDAALPRICTWGQFEVIATGKTFYLFNVHFDHIGEVARKESAKLVLEMMKKTAANLPCMLTGDFNFNEDHESYALINTSGLVKDAYDSSPLRITPNGTFNGFNVRGKPVGRIDNIFITPAFQVVRYGILTNTYNGRFPSDHFPVFAELIF
jgi:endonuclease/exonuclease/phosphatase family metal-dependent hydrolase